jgi:predicted nucleotidyltransferase
VKVFWLDKEYIQRQLMIAVDALKGDGNVLKIILFGSFAEGRAVPGSDVDVLIVLRSDPRRFIDRIPDYLEIFSDLGTGVDVFPYTVDELENPVARNAVATGKVLLERGS